LFVHWASTLTALSSSIDGNEAGADGGRVWASSSALAVKNTIISGNSAGMDGGGIYGKQSDHWHLQ